ncbi:pyrroloquinoline quinone biosynthesis peptide chaperone PqqD, partial [Acinetobacter baumannii]|nr:pyrroloquinoline quinone biosynthesis peptide chaperone PqqD [Acinetobacter baumannii]
GMIKLNESAGAIGQYIDGTNNVSAIIAQLKQQFGDIPEIDNDVIDYMLVAQQQHWIDLV